MRRSRQKTGNGAIVEQFRMRWAKQFEEWCSGLVNGRQRNSEVIIAICET